MLDDSSTKDDHPRPLRPDSQAINRPDIARNADIQNPRRRPKRMEIQHVPDTSIRQGRTENRDGVLMRPVAHGSRVVDFLAQAVDDGAGAPYERIGGSVTLRGLLLGEQRVEDGDEPVFEGAVVAVGHDEVADAVHARGAEAGSGRAEGAEVGGRKAFDQVFLHAAGCCHDGGDVLVLHQVADRVAQPGGDQVGRVAEENGRFGAAFGVSPGSLWDDVNDGYHQ